MRRIATRLSLVAFALGVINGCAATRPMGAINETIDRDPSRTLVADPLVQPRSVLPPARQAVMQPPMAAMNTPAQPSAMPAPGSSPIAQVAHFEDTACSVNQGTAGDCQTCNPAMQGPGICRGPGSCAGCQSCVVQPYGYAPYPPGYFNPNLIDPNEFICDGGDNAPAARARVGDQIVGVELEDTVVRYTTDAGDVHVQPSNKVCLYAPRFAAVRKVTGAESGELAVGAIGVARPEGPIRAELVQPGLAVTGRNELGRGSAVRGPDAMRDRNRGVPVERVLQIEVAEDVLAVLQNLAFIHRGILRDSEKPWLSNAAQSAITWSIDEQAAVTVNDVAAVTLTRDLSAEELVVYDFPDAGRLRLCKLADKSDALPGDTVTFILRVDNVGDSAVRNIVITDSLVTRLEYIADSEKSSIDSEFKAEENEGQSLRLTWKLAKELKVGEGATIEFKCKVR